MIHQHATGVHSTGRTEGQFKFLMIPQMPGFAHWVVRKGLLVVALFIGLNSVQITGKSENVQPHVDDRTGMVEFVGLLEPGGSVSAQALLLRIPHKAEDEKITTDEQIPQQFPEFAPTNYATLLQASLDSQACNSVPPDSIPCFDASSGQYDPQCEMGRLQNPCLVRLPRGYYHPNSWPLSITKVRAQNIASVPNLQSQRGIQIQGSTISFKASGLDTTRKYVDKLLQLLPGLQFGKKTRLVLDLEGYVGSLAVELEKYKALTLSIAAKNSPSTAVELILERGYPALVQTLGKNRLPFPSMAFDLIHCGLSCSIPWTENGGLLLLEVDRVLQRGGLFVWQKGSENEEELTAMTNILLAMCWSLSQRKGRLAIWQKPMNDKCYQLRSELTVPPFCDHKNTSPDDAWGTPLQPCIVRHSSSATETKRHDWPARLQHGTQRLANFRMATVEVYEADLNYWKMMVESYLQAFGPSRISGIRNVLDMNSGYGGFAAAVALTKPPLPWWVLNVSPRNEELDHLATVFDRGLLGVYHDWCRALNTYPRAFDLIHASRLFSAKHSCSVAVIMLEVDRLLRPGGFAVIRDDNETLLEVKGIADALHWKTSIQDSDSGPLGKDKLLHCQKTSWQP